MNAFRPTRSQFLASLGAVAAAVAACSNTGSAAHDDHRFVVFDNMFYRGKPQTSGDGIIGANILYEGAIWPHGVDEGTLPSRELFDSLVRAHAVQSGPLVIDIERLAISKGPQDVATRNLTVLATLADWARAAVPGKAIGYYGSNTLTRVAPANRRYALELAGHVDAFFPPMYTFDDDRVAWASRAEREAAEARSLGAGKPVYFYLWPQYHDGTPKQFAFIDASYWSFQLQTARRFADGVVLWSPSKFAWNDATGWWEATQTFVRSSPSAQTAAPTRSP